MTLPRRILCLITLACLALAFSAGPAPAATKKVLIKAVKEVGTVVILMDGSQWRIDNPEDQDLVYDWLPFQTVTVKDNKVLVNLYRGDIVDARMTKPPVKVAKAPSSTPMYKAGAVTGGAAAPAAAGGQVMVPEDLVKRLDKILKRLEDLEFSVKSVEMRLQRLERMAGVGP